MQYKQKNERCHERKTEPSRRGVQKNQQQTKIVLEYRVFCILQTFMKQEK